MNEPTPPNPNDPRLQAALKDYFDRVDRNEPLNRETFLLEHREIADELRQFIATEDELRRFAAESLRDISQISTGSFSRAPGETLPPKSRASGGDAESDDLSGQFGRYRIRHTLGKGAMGTVYLAEDTQLLREVALKTQQFTGDAGPEMLERFYREARAAATLRHPHICPVYDVGEIGGKHYITMAYIEGQPLSAFVNPAVPQTERQILIVVGKIAQALQVAHDHGIVHRDLKPANIMVDSQGQPVIMDFGLAQHIRPGEDLRLTQTGMLLGSPAYMSPEQVEGDPAKVGPAADQYGLGVILYELLTGQVPFKGSLASVMGQIVSKEPAPPSQFHPGLDPRIEAACLKMMAKNPADRFSSLSAVAQELATIVRGSPVRSESKAPETKTKSASKRPVRNSWQAWTIGSGAAIGLLAAVIIYMRAGKVLLEIEISDPGVQVALRDSTVTLKGPANEVVKVEPGENELTITHGDLQFKTPTFKLEKGNKEIVKVALVGATIDAKLNGENLPLLPLSNSKTPATNDRPITSDAPAKSVRPTVGHRPALLISPFDELEAKKAQDAWSKYLGVLVDTTNSLGMKLMLIPPGKFMMGSTSTHQVRITRPCFFGSCEVTRGQFAKFVEATGLQTLAESVPAGMRLDNETRWHTNWEQNKKFTWRAPGFPQEDDHPVVEITWHEATLFCEWLSHNEGKKYRLPTEAEWEYACRAGTKGRFFTTNDINELTQFANVDDVTARKVFPKWDDDVKTSDGYVYTAPVGHFRPNQFGLYDMLGNAAEWCSDWYAEPSDKSPPAADPTGPLIGTMHVTRGGSFAHAWGTRGRARGDEVCRQPDLGFRVVCEIPGATNGKDSAAAEAGKKPPKD